MLDRPGRLDAIFDAVVADRHGLGRDGLQAVERTEVLEVEAVRNRHPRIERARPAQMGLVAELAFVDVGNAWWRKERYLAVESPDESPGLGARIGPDPGAGRDLIAGRNVDTPTRAIESPVMIRAADLPLDELTDGKIGAEVRAISALDQRLAVRVR